MISVIDDFYERVEEVEDYFHLIESITKLNDNIKEIKKITINNQDISSHITILENDNLIKTTTASFFLILYNLVESTVRQGIIAIYNELSAFNISFNSLRPSLKQRILKDTRSRVGFDQLKQQINNCIEQEIINASLNTKKLFNGNIDRDLIKDYANSFGFSYQTEFDITKHGMKLITIKDHRNDLAHGNTSFKELGRDYSINDLNEYKEEAVYYLLSILENIKKYLNNQEYLNTLNQTN